MPMDPSSTTPRVPGDPGSMKGQIKTPMNAVNTQGSGSGTHEYKDMPAAKGGGASSIKGPGAQGKWHTQIDISGSNLKGKY